MSLANFFSEGWSQPWEKRSHPNGAPDLTLLRVQTNQLLRSLRTDYFTERPLESSGERRVQFVNQLLEYPLNRRLMLAVFGSYQWIDLRDGADECGGSWGGFARFQLVDTERASYVLNLRAAAPNDGLGDKKTTLSFSLAGWHDLTPLGLDRMGLYWHVQEETFLGPRAPGAKGNDLTYAVSLAKTWTSPEAALGNLSTFVEAYAKTDLDGRKAGRSVVTVTPGLRCTFAHRHILMAGLDLPVSSPRPYEQLLRITYIFPF
ncbi:MAG: hypothetical protein WCF18_04830 [Chthoniobacteraceae bacterium]